MGEPELLSGGNVDGEWRKDLVNEREKRTGVDMKHLHKEREKWLEPAIDKSQNEALGSIMGQKPVNSSKSEVQ
jgi:hypothetical protein